MKMYDELLTAAEEMQEIDIKNEFGNLFEETKEHVTRLMRDYANVGKYSVDIVVDEMNQIVYALVKEWLVKEGLTLEEIKPYSMEQYKNVVTALRVSWKPKQYNAYTIKSDFNATSSSTSYAVNSCDGYNGKTITI